MVGTIATLVTALVLGVVVPWVFMRLLVPSLETRSEAQNYRGHPVFLGLGVVWLVWAGCAILAGVVAGSLGSGSVLPILTLAGPLALVAFALGMVDDALGTGADRGFSGHFRALAKGRMTTGMLKLIGMGLACLVVSLVISQVAPWGFASTTSVVSLPGGFALRAFFAVIAAMSVALTANFVNLTDLRPGRALKVYSALVLAGAFLTGMLMAGAGEVALAVVPSQRIVDSLALLVFLLGPVIAVWRFDLGEKGMLGDAGANPMGAVAGLMIVAGLPWWGLMVYFLVVLALNLASERISYSGVIDANSALKRLDCLGRLPDDGQAPTLTENKS